MTRRTPRLLYVVALGLALPFAVFVYLAADVVRTGRVVWDEELAQVASSAVSAVPIPLDGTRLLGTSTVGAPLLVVALGLVLLMWSRPSYALFWTAAMGGVFLLDPFLKVLFRRPGAAGPGGEYSFPSGSAFFGAVAVVAIASLMPTTRLRVAIASTGAAFCLACGAAIVRVDWHYPSDVVAGWALGLAWTTTLWLLFFGFSRSPFVHMPSGRPHVARQERRGA